MEDLDGPVGLDVGGIGPTLLVFGLLGVVSVLSTALLIALFAGMIS